MNLGRFHAAITAICREHSGLEIHEALKKLSADLQNSINSRNNDTAQVFKTTYSETLKLLASAASNNTYPTRQQIYKEINATDFIGNGLAKNIEQIFADNQITPGSALTELNTLIKDVDDFFERLSSVDDNFTELGIEYDDLKNDGFEIGFSLPKNIIGKSVESLEKEFHQINFTIKTFQEVAGVGNESPILKTISASDWQLYIEAVPALATTVVFGIERIVALYKSNLEIRLLKKQLEEKKLPDAILLAVQDHIESTVKTELRKIAEEIISNFYKSTDEGRKNELTTQTVKALRYIADRIDRGSIIEVQAKAPIEPKAKIEGENEVQPDEAKLKEYEEKKKVVEYVNQKMLAASQLAKSDYPVLAIEYDKDAEDKIAPSNNGNGVGK